MTRKEIHKIIKKHKPSQGLLELTEFIQSFKYNPQTILEIGTDRGGLSKVFNDVFSPDILMGIDINAKCNLYDYPGTLFCPMSSRSDETFSLVKKKLNGRYLDLLFIDGDHTYEGVSEDFDRYMTLCSPGSTIAVHDIADVTPGEPEVVKFWGKLRETLIPNWEYNIDGPGIGVINL